MFWIYIVWALMLYVYVYIYSVLFTLSDCLMIVIRLLFPIKLSICIRFSVWQTMFFVSWQILNKCSWFSHTPFTFYLSVLSYYRNSLITTMTKSVSKVCYFSQVYTGLSWYIAHLKQIKISTQTNLPCKMVVGFLLEKQYSCCLSIIWTKHWYH